MQLFLSSLRWSPTGFRAKKSLVFLHSLWLKLSEIFQLLKCPFSSQTMEMLPVVLRDGWMYHKKVSTREDIQVLRAAVPGWRQWLLHQMDSTRDAEAISTFKNSPWQFAWLNSYPGTSLDPSDLCSGGTGDEGHSRWLHTVPHLPAPCSCGPWFAQTVTPKDRIWNEIEFLTLWESWNIYLYMGEGDLEWFLNCYCWISNHLKLGP